MWKCLFSSFSFFFVNLVPFWSAKLKEQQRLVFGECFMVSIAAKELFNVS